MTEQDNVEKLADVLKDVPGLESCGEALWAHDGTRRLVAERLAAALSAAGLEVNPVGTREARNGTLTAKYGHDFSIEPHGFALALYMGRDRSPDDPLAAVHGFRICNISDISADDKTRLVNQLNFGGFAIRRAATLTGEG